VDNKKGSFRSRLLAKLQLGKENRGGDEAMFQNSKTYFLFSFMKIPPDQQRVFLQHTTVSEKNFSIVRGSFVLHLHPKITPLSPYLFSFLQPTVSYALFLRNHFISLSVL
jgi:hypothetical protein